MKLSDYINLTLVEIAKGAQKATDSYQEMGKGRVLAETNMLIDGIPFVRHQGRGDHMTNKPIIKVTFHVGVELDESEESNSQLNESLKVISGSAAALNKEGIKAIQEITFDIPVLLPSEKK